MNNLPTSGGADLSSLIGALELDDRRESHGDGALEAATMNPAPTQRQLLSYNRFLPPVSSASVQSRCQARSGARVKKAALGGETPP